MKDMVIIRTAGFKEMKQKRHLLYKLREDKSMPCFGKNMATMLFQHVLQPTSSQCASQPQYGA